MLQLKLRNKGQPKNISHVQFSNLVNGKLSKYYRRLVSAYLIIYLNHSNLTYITQLRQQEILKDLLIKRNHL